MEIRNLGKGDNSYLANIAPGVFDLEISPRLVEEFLTDPRHHLVVALEGDSVIGMASAFHYIHPDKDPELWINEVGVAPKYQRRGLGKALLMSLLDVGRQHGCTQAWVLTDRANEGALRLYSSIAGGEASDQTVMFTYTL